MLFCSRTKILCNNQTHSDSLKITQRTESENMILIKIIFLDPNCCQTSPKFDVSTFSVKIRVVSFARCRDKKNVKTNPRITILKTQHLPDRGGTRKHCQILRSRKSEPLWYDTFSCMCFLAGFKRYFGWTFEDRVPRSVRLLIMKFWIRSWKCCIWWRYWIRNSIPTQRTV